MMKKLTITILTLLALTACQERPNVSEIEAKLEQKKPIETTTKTKPSPTDALKAFDQTLSGNKDLTAKEVKFETVAYHYELPADMKQICGFDNGQVDKETSESINFCTDIDIKLTKIDPIWIEQIVNKEITSDDNPKLIKFKQNIDDFVLEHLTYINELKESAKENNEGLDYIPLYSWSVMPEILPEFNNVAQIVINTDIYTAGAHGVPDAQYLIFDMDLQSQITLYEVIEKNQTEAFYELAYTAFKAYLKKELDIDTQKEIKEYEETWAFKLSENFYFNKEGITLVYSPYELGAYAQGFIELTIPYSQLSDILKGQYLPNVQPQNETK